MEDWIRFIVGGLVVSLFAMLGDMFKPKSFAGLFGAAPSIALTTLVLAVHKYGTGYIALEARSMVLGALAMWVYCLLSSWFLLRLRANALAVTGASLIVWFCVAFALLHIQTVTRL